jgi:hypothetical protein
MIKITYVGRRLWGSKLMHVFLHGKKERGWAGIRGAIIGYIYMAEKKGAHLQLSKRPERHGDPWATENQLMEWEAKDVAAFTETRKRRAEASVRKNLPLTKKLEELRPFIMKLSWLERKALFEYMIDHF